MPIKPENRARYPADWEAIRTVILERAGHRCEHPGCGARNYAVGRWLGDKFSTITEAAQTYAQAKQAAADEHWVLYGDESNGPRVIVIVLTVAHLDHTPENCAPENLRAWCQRHHLAYDHQHHIANAYGTRRAKLGNMELELSPAGTTQGEQQ